MEGVSCPVCMNYFDRVNCIPMTLSDCGHGICIICLKALIARGPMMYKCPSCRVKIRNEPQQNYDLMNLIDEISVQKEVKIKIGYIPSFASSAILKTNLLGRIKNKDKLISIELENDKESVCEEQIAVVTFQGSYKNDYISELDQKIFSYSDNEMHCMMNVVSASNPLLNKEVKNNISARGFDVVLLIPNKPAFGYNISILMDNSLIPQDINFLFLWNKSLKFKTKCFSRAKSKSKTETYLVLYLSSQDDLLDCSEILKDVGLKIKDFQYKVDNVEGSLTKFYIVP